MVMKQGMFYKIFVAIFIVLLSGFNAFSNNSSAITYVLNRGRFGDHLLNYSKAKWISYKYDLPLYYRHFKYSNYLKMHEIENVYNMKINKNFRRIFKFDKKKGFAINKADNCLYVSNCYAFIDINWEDKSFVNEIKKTIAPRINIPKYTLPKGRISVAVHVRKGGGFDEPLVSDPDANKKGQRWGYYADKVYLLKFPPDEYYIDQIKRLYEILNHTPLHIHVFTDDHTPMRIVEKFKQNLAGLDITFSCRESDNNHDKNVIEDFFGMTQYDCLIRNGSHFSFFADIIGDFAVVIYPEHAFWEGNKLIVDKVEVKINRKI